MSRRFTFVTLALTAIVAFLVGAIFAGGLTPSPVVSGTMSTASTASTAAARTLARPAALPGSASIVNFADVVERINPAVVNIDATTPGRDTRGRRGRSGAPGIIDPPDLFDGPD